MTSRPTAHVESALLVTPQEGTEFDAFQQQVRRSIAKGAIGVVDRVTVGYTGGLHNRRMTLLDTRAIKQVLMEGYESMKESKSIESLSDELKLVTAELDASAETIENSLETVKEARATLRDMHRSARETLRKSAKIR